MAQHVREVHAQSGDGHREEGAHVQHQDEEHGALEHDVRRELFVGCHDMCVVEHVEREEDVEDEYVVGEGVGTQVVSVSN